MAHRLIELHRQRLWVRNNVGELEQKTRSWLKFEEDFCSLALGRIDYCIVDAPDNEAYSCNEENYFDLHDYNDRLFSYDDHASLRNSLGKEHPPDEIFVPEGRKLRKFLLSNCWLDLRGLDYKEVEWGLNIDDSISAYFPKDENTTCSMWFYRDGKLEGDEYYDPGQCFGEEEEDWDCHLGIRTGVSRDSYTHEKNEKFFIELNDLWRRLITYCNS